MPPPAPPANTKNIIKNNPLPPITYPFLLYIRQAIRPEHMYPVFLKKNRRNEDFWSCFLKKYMKKK